MKSESGSCICEVHDPSGVFPLITQQIQSLLPLRSLNWKSGDRPLRSIDSLHVDFREAKEGSSSRPQSSSSAADGLGTTTGPLVKERRHQIPGLRQTPYLKLYVLRCDDVDTYRESSRKTLREWLKTHTPPSQKSSSSAQENHDAFEWMIVHVVVPNTVAASQPRYSKSSSKDDDEEPANPKGGGSSRLKIGRKSNTLLEKIKADFNVSGKSAPDRVAQVRLQDDEVPKQMLPSKSLELTSHIESPPERNAAWADLITKVRNLILASFTLRVGQYEDDIRERGSQRSLPGWNFCTFFVLKEGLARGFESVGLLDDALLGYDELGIELDSVIKEPGLGTVFLPFTEDMTQLLDILQSRDEVKLQQWQWQTQPISATLKAYRELILANQVSIFDFKSYIFARQLEILLRMGFPSFKGGSKSGAQAGDRRSNESTLEVEDVAVVAEICRRASLFISEVSRILAQEIVQATVVRKADVSSTEAANIASSWSFATAQQMIKSTQSPKLVEKLEVAKSDFRTCILDPSPPSKRRASVQPDQTAQIPEIIRKVVEGYDEYTTLVAYDHPPTKPLTELASRRIDMVILQRQIIEALSVQRGWHIAWPMSKTHKPASAEPVMEDVSLNDDDTDSPEDAQTTPSQDSEKDHRGLICVSLLSNAMESETKCGEIYHQLTLSAIHHTIVSNSVKALEKLLADLAMIYFQAEKFEIASRIFDMITRTFATGQWGVVETQLLAVHAKCLRELGRIDSYVHKLLMLVKYSFGPETYPKPDRAARSPTSLSMEDAVDINGILGISSIVEELERTSDLLDDELEAEAAYLFTDIAVQPHIEHYEDRDGFCMKLRYRHVVNEPIDGLSVTLHLKSVNFFGGHELLLHADKPQLIRGKPLTATLRSSVSILDEFTIEKLTFTINKLTFVHDDFHRSWGSRMRLPRPGSHSLSEARLQLLSYPRQGALRIETEYSRHVQIDKIRGLKLSCYAGENNIERIQLRIRAATGGLRLRTGELREIDSGKRVLNTPKPGIVETTGLQPDTTLTLTVPFDLDANLSDIIVRIEATYETENGIFEYISSPIIKIALPLDVSVHDLFKSAALFSRFGIRSADNGPMDLTDIQLEGTDEFKIEAPPCAPVPATVYARQPLPVLYKVRNTEGKSRGPLAKEVPLQLKIEYRQVREVVTEVLRQNIRQALTDSDVKEFANLIEENLVGRVAHVMTPEQLTQSSMLQEITVPSYEAMDWSALLRLLPDHLADRIGKFLQECHKRTREMALDGQDMAEALRKLTNTLIITVPVPRLQVLHTVSLTPSKSQSLYTTGSIMTATLSIHDTRKWDSPSAISSLLKSDAPLSFSVEIDAAPDQWLVGGMRRFQITPEPEQTLKIPVMLIPLRAGRLILPNVQVRLTAGKDGEKLSCATDYVDSGSSVVVVDGVGSSTVRLREGLGGTEVLVTNIKGREAVA